MTGGVRTVCDLLDRAAGRAPDAIAVRDATGAWTYPELRLAAGRVAAALRRRGVTRGDRVLVSLANSRHLVAVLYGALSAGAAVVPVSVQARPYHLAAVAGDAEPRLAIADTAERLASLAAGVPVAAIDQVMAETDHTGHSGVDGAEPDGIALLIYTSGSTAGPKGVVSRHRQVLFAVDAIAGRLGYRSDDVVCCRLPFSFDYALYQAFLSVHAGAELAMVDARDELTAFRALREFRATVLPVVPPVAQTLLALAGRRASEAPAPLRLITNTGAELTRSVADRLRAAFPGAAVVPMYGMTECKRISIAAPDEDLSKPGTVGTPLPGTSVTVVGEDGEALPAGQVGEIVVRGPHLMDGYWRDPVASAERFRVEPATGERYLRTGDFGAMDADGALRIVGRRDDVFKRRGVRTSVNEIEAAALDIPEVQECAAALVGTARECVLWVRGDIPPEHVLKGIGERLEPAKIPDRCLVVDALPRTPNGKIDKNLLKAELAGER
ncbi:class I adenylate-forming enzyme family protein [Phytohabitans aurantiacus]|uniref:AMP-dependent synthetase and ligase n=1 Tax=Phytohabitans aurantiacus TaxID=3016789 RepID=A0ABQ5QXK0_9ACTN|nr:class I adenylate-forming enzyme family protein [Phytohabitans aurantiacus]GLH99258.1 AMP-dependent synthetase and ligase [Phytohabitans aurantiacus]